MIAFLAIPFGSLSTRHYPDHMGFFTPHQIDRRAELNGQLAFAPYFSFTFPGIHIPETDIHETKVQKTVFKENVAMKAAEAPYQP